MKKFLYLLILLYIFKDLSAAVQVNNPDARVMPTGDVLGIYHDSSDDTIKSSLYSGGAWSVPVTISGSGLSSHPYLAMDVTSGYAVAVWVNIDSSNGLHVLYGSIYSPLTGLWTVPAAITSNTVSVDPESIRLSMNQQGNLSTVIVIWRQFTGFDQEIVASVASVGSGWGISKTVS